MTRDDDNFKTWKEWAIKESYEKEILETSIESVQKDAEQTSKDIEKLNDLFKALDKDVAVQKTKIYTAISVAGFIIVVIEFILKFVVK